MANLVGDIAIQVGADIGPLVTQLGKASGAVSKFGKDAQASSAGMALASKAGVALGGAAVAAGAAMVAFTRAAMNNIDALSKQARVAGVSVSTFQAMSLVAEEAGVSSEALSKSLVKMQDNLAGLSRGSKTQVAAFEQIGLSFADLNGLATDEQFALIAEKISAISDPISRTAAALDVFGKSGADALNMMTGYGAAIQNATAFQEQFGLAVSDTDAANIEAANDAIGRAQIAIGSLGTELAVTFAPAIEQVAVGLQNLISDIFNVDTALQDALGGEAMARAILGEELYNKLNASAEAFRDNASAVGALNGTLQYTADFADQAAMNFGFMAQRLQQVGELDLASKFADLSEEIQRANDDWRAGKIPLEQYRATLETARDRATELIAEASKVDGVDLANVKGQVGGLAKLLEIAAQKAFQLRATLASGGVSTVGASASASGSLDMSSPLAPKTSPVPPSAPTSVDFGVDMGGGGGGGSGSNGADALQRMQDQFATESEVIAAQYAERLARLEEFRQQKLLSEEAFNELESKIKDDHEKNLADIESKRRNERLSAISGAFGDLAALTQSGNEKLFKIGQAAKVAEAIVEGYSAAVAAWNKGMKVGGPGMAAAFTAASLVKTGALIASMKSQSSSGGGSSGAGGGGGGAAAAAPSQAPLQVNLNTFGAGDFISKMDFGNLLTQLNTAAGDRGYTILRTAT